MNFYRFTCLFIIISIFLCAGIYAQPAGVSVPGEVQADMTIDFEDGDLSNWSGSGDYALSIENGMLRVDANKRNTWNSFVVEFDFLDLSENPYVSVFIRAEEPVNLGFSILDGFSTYSYPKPMYQEVVASEHGAVYTFDFTEHGAVDMAHIQKLNFVCNPGGALSYEGTVFIDDIRIGDDALVVPTLRQVHDQIYYIGTETITIPLYRIDDAVEGDQPLAIEGSADNTDLITNVSAAIDESGTTGSATLTINPELSGKGTVTLTLTGNAPNPKTVSFDVDIFKNKPPAANTVPQTATKAGVQTIAKLTGIHDGNTTAEQVITIAATSSNPDVLPDPVVEYDQGVVAQILLNPPVGASGEASVSLTLTDDGGTADGGQQSSVCSFKVLVYPDINQPPAIDQVEDVAVLDGSGTQQIMLTGIAPGDTSEAAQQLSISVTSSNETSVPVPAIDFTPGDSTALLTYTPVTPGDSEITVALEDDGGTDNNDGDKTTTMSFTITVRQQPVTGLLETYDDGVLPPQWPAEYGGTGEGTHRASVVDGALRIEIDKTRTGNKWAGLWYGIPKELDLTEYPYMSIKMKCDPPGTNMLIFLWDVNDKYNTGGTVEHFVSGEWVEYKFDFTGLNLNRNGEEVDFSRIKALLINFDPGGDSPLFTGEFWFDDFAVGSEAQYTPPAPTVTIDNIPDLALEKNFGEYTVKATGISDGGEGSNPVTLQVTSSNMLVLPVPEAGEIVDGEVELILKSLSDATGTSKIVITASAEGSTEKIIAFDVDVLEVSNNSIVDVSVDLETTYQTIDGFGAFMGSGSGVMNDRQIELAADIGMTMARYGVVNTMLEPENDNSDPYVMDLNALDPGALPMETMRRLRDRTEVEKNIVTSWSPPVWMKQNKSLDAEYWATDNKLLPFYYEEFAEQWTALIKLVKQETGIDLYAVSLQNEPEFNEPYASCVITANEYRDIIKVVGPRLEAEGLDTKLFWAEVLPAQNHVDDYINAVKNDPEARKYIDIVAIHNYDADGISVGGAGAETWQQIFAWAQDPVPAMPTWMSETSGHANSWDGALELAGNIFNALNWGNASAWVYWSWAVPKSSEVFGLVVDNEPTQKYFVSKHYYKYIKPGAVRRDVISNDPDIAAIGFKHDERGMMTVVMLNKSDQSKVVSLNGAGLPGHFNVYLSSKKRNYEHYGTTGPGGTVLLPPKSVSTFFGDYNDPLTVEETEAIPELYQLSQNYPNPFNPVTTIQYTIPVGGNVTMNVYNILGQKVTTLVDNQMAAGRHTVKFDASRFASGVYFYSIKVNDFVKTKKMMLLK